MTSRYIEVRPDNIPSNGKISFKNGFPVMSFTISAQDGLLDPRSVRICGKFQAFKDNLATPTPIVDADALTMNNRLGIYNVVDALTIRSQKSALICESIRHYSKFMNTYLSLTSSLQDQVGHLSQTCLIQPNSETFRKSVMNNASTLAPQTNSFSAHLPCGFLQSGNMVNLRQDAFGGVQIEIQLTPDANVLYNTNGSSAGVEDAHYQLSDVKLICEVQDIDDDSLRSGEDTGMYEFNSITSLYTSINSTNAQLQYNLALRNVLSAFVSFVPVANINTLTQDGQTTTYPSGVGTSNTQIANISRVQFLKGGSKYPADFDFVNTYDAVNNPTPMPDPQIVKGLYDAVVPDGTSHKYSISPVNMNRNYDLANTAASQTSYTQIAEGGSVMGLGTRYGLGGAGEDFSTEQWGLSVESEHTADNPVGAYIFIKAKAQLVFSPNGVQLLM
tara:strand:- start:1753 stop:3087 length:1335 start_codon:yes stop_codon:yes gene_type:complete